MDEEEELENTLIGQEEEAPAMDTGDALMGAGQPMPTMEEREAAAGFQDTMSGRGQPMPTMSEREAAAGLLNTMSGREAADVGTSDALIGKPSFLPYADDVAPSRVNALSVFTPGGDLKPGIDVNAITPSPTTLPTPSVVNTALPQESGQLPQALPALTAVATDQPQTAVSPFLQSPDTPSGLGGPLLRGFEMVNDAARGPNAPMGQDETRARLGGMTLNEYLNAPAGTPGVSGLRTDPQGRMISSPAPAVVNNFAPQTPSVRATPAPFPNTEGREIRDMLFRGPPSARPLPNDPPGFGTRPLPNDSASTRPNVDPGFIQQPSLRDPDAGFSPRPLPNDPTTTGPGNVRDMLYRNPVPNLSNFERDSLARQIAIGGTGSFAGDSAAREARLAARPSFNEVRRDSDRRGGISQSDARDLAQGMARGATEGERARALEIQSRLGLGQFEPERELTDLEKREIESQIRAREAGIAASERKGSFEPRIVTIDGQRAIELSPGNFQQIQKDTPNKTGLQKTLENLQADLDSGRLTQEEYDIGAKNARDLYIRREKPKGQTSSSEFENIIKGDSAGDAPKGDATDAPQVATGRGQARRGRPAEGADASDIKSFATEAEARASGEKGEVLIGGRRAVIE
tara:strand:+ start:630 stop:2525 length:1896 start_codon:yes stop_codon:yes gene_type:complete